MTQPPDVSGDVVIRMARPEDVPSLMTMIGELAEFERLRHEVAGNADQLATHLFGERPMAEALLAEVSEEVAGFALFFPNFSTFLTRPGMYLEDLYVRPTFRGRGIGRALLARLARLCRERGCVRLEWWVLDWNESAIRFYRDLDAQPMTDWTVFRLTGEALDRLANSAPAG